MAGLPSSCPVPPSNLAALARPQALASTREIRDRNQSQCARRACIQVLSQLLSLSHNGNKRGHTERMMNKSWRETERVPDRGGKFSLHLRLSVALFFQRKPTLSTAESGTVQKVVFAAVAGLLPLCPKCVVLAFFRGLVLGHCSTCGACAFLCLTVVTGSFSFQLPLATLLRRPVPSEQEWWCLNLTTLPPSSSSLIQSITTTEPLAGVLGSRELLPVWCVWIYLRSERIWDLDLQTAASGTFC